MPTRFFFGFAICVPLALSAACGRRSAAIVSPGADLASAVDAAPQVIAPDQQAAREGGESNSGFRFPPDRGGKFLEEILAPPPKLPPPDAGSAAPSRLRSASLDLDARALPLPPVEAERPRPAQRRNAGSARPTALAEEVPLDVGGVARSQLPDFPAQKRARIPSPDVNEPIALPRLGLRQPDGMPGEDPTAEFSLQAALAAPWPARTQPAPFTRTNLPDPYEHRRTGMEQKEDRDASFSIR
jgi:hypothetical protein